MLHVGGNADDRHVGWHDRHADGSAERVLARPVLVGHRAAHDSDDRRVGGVGRKEVASAEESRPYGAEITG